MGNGIQSNASGTSSLNSRHIHFLNILWHFEIIVSESLFDYLPLFLSLQDLPSTALLFLKFMVSFSSILLYMCVFLSI